MEQLATAAPAAQIADEATCVACHSAVDGPRCGHCGAASAPGGYRVRRVIAQTPHSRMYLAEDASRRRVAVKELHFALVPGMDQLTAFEREAAVLRGLDHPRIPAFVTSFTEGTGVGTRLYLVQELVEGESLQQRLLRAPLSEEEVWRVAGQVLEVLHHLHSREPRLVHRDVKPANLILRPDGELALVDFGAVRDLRREQTHGSTLVGTFGYMPPEQLGGTVDATSDLYALGATLIHALSGIPPADLVGEGLELRFEDKVQASGELRAFLKRLVAPKRAARFGSAAEALKVVQARSPARARAAPAPRQAGRGVFILAALGAMAVLVGLALSFVVAGRDGPLSPEEPGPHVVQPYEPPPASPAPPPPPPPPPDPGSHRHFRTSSPSQQRR
jgi:serine/threonine-protein kinase